MCEQVSVHGLYPWRPRAAGGSCSASRVDVALAAWLRRARGWDNVDAVHAAESRPDTSLLHAMRVLCEMGRALDPLMLVVAIPFYFCCLWGMGVAIPS